MNNRKAQALVARLGPANINMIIKEIEISDSITIEMPGVVGQAKYRKFGVRMVAQYSEEDYPLGVEGEYKDHYAKHLKRVEEAIREKANKIMNKK